MIGPDMTWGDAREIYKNWLNNPLENIEDNILANPEVRKLAQGRDDNEYVNRPGEFRGGEEPESDPASDPESGLGETVEFYILFDDEDDAHLLIRMDHELGTLEFRGKDEWILVQPGDDMPVLDDYPYTQVTGQAVPIWDSLADDDSGEDGGYTKSTFQSTLLDDVDE